METMEHRHRLVQFTDTHLLADPQGSMRGIRPLPALEACIADARRRFLPADAILVTGDLVQDEPDGYGFLELALAPLGAPILLIPGNHDAPADLHRRLSHPPFQVGGSFALGSWVIVLLDTWFAASANGEGRLGPERLEALDQALTQHASRHVLVFMHHPPMAMGGAGLDALGLVDGAECMAILDRHSNVRGVSWGHAHQAFDLYRDGVRFMCTPATCMQFRPRSAGIEIDDRPPGYRVLDLAADGSLSSEVAWLEGYAQ
jgi:3',5'-cyclic-AMP phosphodiesterase